MNWLWFIIGFVSPIIIFFVYVYISALLMAKRNAFIPQFCNDCKKVFDDTAYKYCPYCGKKLDYHKDCPESQKGV